MSKGTQGALVSLICLLGFHLTQIFIGKAVFISDFKKKQTLIAFFIFPSWRDSTVSRGYSPANAQAQWEKRA